MRFVSAIAVVGALLALLPAAAAAGRRYESHIYFHNQSDAYVWVTAYERNTDIMTGQMGKTVGAWCVAPGKYDQHGVTARVNEVRAEVSAGGCQRNPTLLNALRGFPYGEHDGLTSHTMTYYVHGKGSYAYSNTP